MDKDGEVYGDCDEGRIQGVYSGVPPYGHCEICSGYSKLPTYKPLEYDECIFCKHWVGVNYEDIISKHITLKTAKILKQILKQEIYLSNVVVEEVSDRFADLDHIE